MKKHKHIFFKRINTWISQNSRNLDNIILCEDFNCQLDVNITMAKECRNLKENVEMMDLNDCWVSTGKNCKQDPTHRR